MDRRSFLLHASAAVGAAVVGKVSETENEPAVAPDRVHETRGVANFDPWHFHWDQPMTRLTEREAMGQVALGTPLFDPRKDGRIDLLIEEANKRPLIFEQRLDGLPEPVYYLMGHAYLEVSLHGQRVARSPYLTHTGVNDVIGPGTWQLFAQGTRDIKQKQDTPQSRAVADWICLNVDTSKGWEKILDHLDDWFARLIVDERVRKTIHNEPGDGKAEWNAKFRDALTHGPNRK